MASVVSSASPAFLRADSSDDTDSWHNVDTSTSTPSPAVDYLPSPGSSFNGGGWGVVGYPNSHSHNHLGAASVSSPSTGGSPMPFDQRHHYHELGHTSMGSGGVVVAPTSYPTSAAALGSHHGFVFHQSPDFFFPDFLESADMLNMSLFAPPSIAADGSSHSVVSDMSGFEDIGIDMDSIQSQNQSQPVVDLDILIDYCDGASSVEPWAPVILQQEREESFMFITPAEEVELAVDDSDVQQKWQERGMGMKRSLSFQSIGTGGSMMASPPSYQSSMVVDVPTASSSSTSSSTSASASASVSASASGATSAPRPKPGKDKATDPVKKIKTSSGKVTKTKKKSTPTSSPTTPRDNFVVVTPDTINQQSGKPNPFECFEVMGPRSVPSLSSSHQQHQRGRKGPLDDEAAESALIVRRKGACFCCRSRKVKCDEERPCKNCRKIAAQVPQVMCWQFSDFTPILFPNFIRSHFKKAAMAQFISENVVSFQHHPSSSSSSSPPSLSTGVKSESTRRTYSIELTSGSRFRSTLTVPASLFTPKGTEVLQHWHMGMGVGQLHQLDLHARSALPLGVDPSDGDGREALRRRAREYVQGLVEEPRFAERVTEPLRGTRMPARVLGLVHRFAQRSRSGMVRRALGVYAAHYVLTRQLYVTQGSLARLSRAGGEVFQQFPTHPAMTARILNRQIKAVLDEHLQKETQLLFQSLSSALKPRSRAEWAPCLASFLVLCLLFEGIEAAADTFVVSEAEVALREALASASGRGGPCTTTNPAKFAREGRNRALDVVKGIDNMPFRQVAYRFHAVYQTHRARELGVGHSYTPSDETRGKVGGGVGGDGATFNPLGDKSLDLDLEPAAAELAAGLRALLGDKESCRELRLLVADPTSLLTHAEAHPYPRDVTLDYTGRLLARFLLSFGDEKYLFD
ncbi:hypothetical protein F5Y17DRAFT_433703 [Xylariaceae sp. FL0594]|nr:hypothetical protein F5Y17DRAFT_433703 [Xylariaceae sp. FL0594]